MSGELLEWAQDVERFGAPVLAPLLIVTAALIAAGVAIVTAPRARTSSGRAWALAPATLLTLGAAGCLAALIAEDRDQLLAWVLEGSSRDVYSGSAPWPLFMQLRMLPLVELVLALAIPGTALAYARAFRRVGPLFLMAAAVSIAAAFAVGWLDAERLTLLRSIGPHEAWRAAGAEWATLRLAPVVVALLCMPALVFLRWRSHVSWTTSWRAPAIAGSLAALAALAFISTRGHAADARRWTPLATRTGTWVAPSELASIPSSACVEPAIAPVLDLREEVARLDGMRVDPETTRENLATMRRNWRILHPRGEPLDVVRLIAPLEREWPELEPYLVAAYRAGLTRARFVFRRPAIAHTDVRGPIDAPRGCDVPVRHSPYIDSTEYPRYEPGPFADERWPTVGAHVREATRHRLGYAYLRSLTSAW
ncbi:MAG: hypothetical protein AB7S26_11995 [Sandaracinaceae bacterium]